MPVFLVDKSKQIVIVSITTVVSVSIMAWSQKAVLLIWGVQGRMGPAGQILQNHHLNPKYFTHISKLACARATCSVVPPAGVQRDRAFSH